MEPKILVGVCFALAATATALVIRNAKALLLVQSPNARSSHVKPTPTGGGIGIALGGMLFGLIWPLQSGSPAGMSILLFSAMFAILGLVDDIRDLSSRLRFAIQILLVGGLLFLLHPLPAMATPLGPISGYALTALLLLAGIWWINLFNFMDGIDGIAASQGIYMLLAGATFSYFAQPAVTTNPFWWWTLAVAASTAGFLLFNWAPAKIFMGDAGSNYLAFMILALATISVSSGWASYATWSILAAVFVSDATITLLRRLANGERVFAAHRRHAYQFLSRRMASHGRATGTYLAINVFWLLPMAAWAHARPQWAWIIVIAAYLPLVALMLRLGAGRPER